MKEKSGHSRSPSQTTRQGSGGRGSDTRRNRQHPESGNEPGEGFNENQVIQTGREKTPEERERWKDTTPANTRPSPESHQPAREKSDERDTTKSVSNKNDPSLKGDDE